MQAEHVPTFQKRRADRIVAAPQESDAVAQDSFLSWSQAHDLQAASLHLDSRGALPPKFLRHEILHQDP